MSTFRVINQHETGMGHDDRGLSVLHVVLSLDVGGLEHIVLNLVKEGVRAGHSVSILCLEKTGVLAPDAERLGATVHCVHKAAGIEWRVVKRISAVLESIRPDIVHTHHLTALLYAGPAARGRGCKIVHTQHNSHFFEPVLLRDKLKNHVSTILASQFTRMFFCVSQNTAETVLKHHLVAKKKVSLVPNGIDLDQFAASADRCDVRTALGIPADAIVIGTVGRLNEVKRQDILIAAFAKLATEFPNTHLLLVGDGPMSSALLAQTSSLGLNDRVHFTGYQAEPQKFLGTIDVFALTSRAEGLPLSVLEAGAMGIPVVASNVGGLHEASDGGRTMLLYDFADFGTLVSCLRRLIEDSGFRVGLGAAVRAHVETTYSMAQMAAEYERHYRMLLGR
jgi:glycosyltransferase involved in cell wall biosynthesis